VAVEVYVGGRVPCEESLGVLVLVLEAKGLKLRRDIVQ
jgi:hypothetical protein